VLCGELTIVRDLALVFKIALVSDNHHREVVFVLYSQDLLLEGCDFLKALARCDGVDEKETLAGAHVLLAHRRVLFLASRVENIEQRHLIVDNALLPVRIWYAMLAKDAAKPQRRKRAMRTFNCRIVFVYEMGLDQLDGEARFTDATTSNDHQLVLSCEL